MNALDRETHFAPGKLWSLLDLVEFKLRPFFEATLAIASLSRGSSSPTFDHQSEVDMIKASLARLKPELANLQAGGASLTMAYDRLEKSVALGASRKFTEDYTHQFQRILYDELSGTFLMSLSATEKELLEQPEPLFGEAVQKAFQQASEDIAEAGKCLALGRSTATVFHLMRALEVAAGVIATKIGAAVTDTNGRGLPWGVIADNMKPEIDKMPKGSEEQIKWYRVQSQLEVVNRAWRVPTAHPKHTYTPEEATAVFSATKSFMQDLALLV